MEQNTKFKKADFMMEWFDFDKIKPCECEGYSIQVSFDWFTYFISNFLLFT